MNTLIVSHYFLPHVGGVEILVDYEIRALLSAGHHITLVTSDGTGGTQHPAYPDSVRIVHVKAWHVLERHFNLPYPLFSPSLIRHLWREIGRCDVMHIHGFMFHSSLVAVLLGRLRGKKVILTDHGGMQQFDSKVKSLLVRIGAETVGRITACCSDRLVAYNMRITRLLERLTRRWNSALFLPNPVDALLFRKVGTVERDQLHKARGWPSTRNKVLFVGRLTTEKGVPQLLECIAPDYDIVFCGSGDPSILGSLPRSGIEYLPPRSQAELAKLYQAADVLIVPSKVREGFPLVVQEALACGLKVVLGYDEGFEPYRTIEGLSFCQVQVDDMRQAILAALQSSSGLRSSQTAAEFFPSPERWIQRLYEGMT